MAMRSKSRWPDWVMRRPPFSSSCSRTPIFSSDWQTLRSTEPEASTWWLGREPRFFWLPWTCGVLELLVHRCGLFDS